MTAALLEDWELTLDGATMSGRTAVVPPVRTAGGRPAVLKVVTPHPEAEHEHLALKRWAGAGTVELIRADPRRWALLLERLHPEDLADLWDLEACEIVAASYRRLHVPALPQLRTLSSYVATAGPTSSRRCRPGPRSRPAWCNRRWRSGATFAADPACDGRIIHGDLHYENVLAGDREPWLVIDPKPMSGDPHYEVAPMLWNRFEELAGDVRDGVRRRFHTIVDTAELDEARARDWVVFRMVCNAMGGMDATECVAIAKAVQD